jgi:hypothetical protein
MMTKHEVLSGMSKKTIIQDYLSKFELIHKYSFIYTYSQIARTPKDASPLANQYVDVYLGVNPHFLGSKQPLLCLIN